MPLPIGGHLPPSGHWSHNYKHQLSSCLHLLLKNNCQSPSITLTTAVGDVQQPTISPATADYHEPIPVMLQGTAVVRVRFFSIAALHREHLPTAVACCSVDTEISKIAAEISHEGIIAFHFPLQQLREAQRKLGMGLPHRHC